MPVRRTSSATSAPASGSTQGNPLAPEEDAQGRTRRSEDVVAVVLGQRRHGRAPCLAGNVLGDASEAQLKDHGEKRDRQRNNPRAAELTLARQADRKPC